MHSFEDFDCLMAVMPAQEAARIWRLSRNAVSDACRRGTLRGRQSGQTWLVTVSDILHYQNGRYSPDTIPEELKPAFDRAIANMKAGR
jgi:hypothetical protein